MQVVFFSSNIEIIDEWKLKHKLNLKFQNTISVSDIDTLNKTLEKFKNSIIISDYDSVAQDINKMIASNFIPNKLIVLEKIPEIVTGKMLISHGIKAYGNTRMLNLHYFSMIESVSKNNIWTYPKLTASLIENIHKNRLSEESLELIEHRLTQKEREVIKLVLDGLTNDAISTELGITTRTVKAHMSSIFSKLHVNDRLALVLLLK